MMNISITNLCNRRCDYCFQKTWYLSDKTYTNQTVQEITVDQFTHLLQWSNVLHLKLMGGEPLLHSKLNQLIDVAYNLGKDITLISNISVDQAIIQSLFEQPSSRCIRSILVNSDYPANQKQIFTANFEWIVKNTDVDISISSTLLPDVKEQQASVQRILGLIAIYTKYRSIETLNIRLSPFCPKPGTPYKEHDYSTELTEYFNTLWSLGLVSTHFDCTVLDSEINPQATEQYRKAGIRIKKDPCDGIHGLPLDVMVDGSVIWCSSCNYIKLDNYKDYRNIRELKTALIDKWKQFYQQLGSPKLCGSFCMAKAICKNEVPIKVFKKQSN